MKIVVAIDSFKGSLSSLKAGSAVNDAIKRLDENAIVIVKPLADGGEGTVNDKKPQRVAALWGFVFACICGYIISFCLRIIYHMQ